MKQGLQLRVGQHLSMTPQLQQAIKLLQLSSLDLQQEIQQVLCSNPLLELADELDQDNPLQENPDQDNPPQYDLDQNDDQHTADSNGNGNGNDTDLSDVPDQDSDPTESGTEPSATDGTEFTHDDDLPDHSSEQLGEDWSDQIPDDLPVDARWDDVYQTPTSSTSTASSKADSVDFESYHSTAETLHDRLHWQLNLTEMSDIDRGIADALIDAIDESGFLSLTVEDIWEGLKTHHSAISDASNENNEDFTALEDFIESEDLIELDEVMAVLHRVQQFDPPGVGALDLSDCLMIQLKQMPTDTPYIEIALILSEQYLQQIANREYALLCRKLELDESELRAAIQLIQTLSPRPGDHIRSEDTAYIVPDARVRREQGRWLVTLNNDTTPKLCINQQYASYVQRGDNSPDNQFLRENLQEARWFLRSLESRNDTLLRVSLCIVDMQKGFLERGPEAMKPMVLADVAERLELHESTISRVTTQKYLDTPQGIYELKYFFSSHVNTDAGGECSSTAIRAMIKKIILNEPTEKPLSDNKLTTLLQDRGIQVARRTVAKYRESLGIPSSSDRKRYKRSA
ncbi:MAG: RNA polymerase factor sigma-54 [Porticoccaceae bacterium]|nr:RNA polymerase factor sigma-54 [Porticoccaceae bacterium]